MKTLVYFLNNKMFTDVKIFGHRIMGEEGQEEQEDCVGEGQHIKRDSQPEELNELNF
jgi:hypothetical protein